MDFDTFIDKAWDDHAADSAAVARRLDDGIALVVDEAQLNRLMALGHHVHGEHLGQWAEGIDFVERLAALPAYAADGESGRARARCQASLSLSGWGDAAALTELSSSDRIRVGAMAAANLAERDTARANRLMQEAIDLARTADLPATDPMHRALAVACNNLASSLEDKIERSADERTLMILAAQTARHHWAITGTWLEIERAEYRLAHTWLKAGDLARARGHAQACLDIVAANEGVPLERLFGWEALGLVERAAGNASGHAQAVARAREAFAQLDEADAGWCAGPLAQLAA